MLTQKDYEEHETRYIALYCRVSTDEQAREGVSLEEQQERLQAYCKAMGWATRLHIYIDDGYSAKNLDRPELKKLIQAVKNGTVSRVLVTKLDRMSRKLLDLLNLIDLFSDYEVSFVSISESFDTHTPSGRLTLQVLGAVAEFERERIRERVFENMLHAASTGKWLTQSPYGYNLVDKALEINEREAEVVRKVYDWYVNEGLGYYAIAKSLNEEGIPSKHQKEWSIRAIKRMLSNPAYKGTMMWNRKDSGKARRKEKDMSEWVTVEDCLPVIIEKSLWERAQQRMNQKTIAPRAKSSPHLLGGMLRCGNCGSGMSIGFSGSQKHRYRVYRCSANKNKGTCTSKQYRANEVETWFKSGLLKLSGNSGMLSILDKKTYAKSEREQLEQRVHTAKARYKRKIEAYTAGLIELVDLNEEKKRLEQAMVELNNFTQEENGSIDLVVLQQEVNHKLKSLINAIDILPIEQVKGIIQTFISHVIIHDEEDIEIILHPL